WRRFKASTKSSRSRPKRSKLKTPRFTHSRAVSRIWKSSSLDSANTVRRQANRLGIGLTQLPRAAHRAGEHGVGLGVALETLRFGIPFQLVAQPDRDVGQMTDRRNAMANIDREVGVFAGLDALEEVIVFAFRISVEMNFVGPDD